MVRGGTEEGGTLRAAKGLGEVVVSGDADGAGCLRGLRL
jgi:hypothetical protein